MSREVSVMQVVLLLMTIAIPSHQHILAIILSKKQLQMTVWIIMLCAALKYTVQETRLVWLWLLKRPVAQVILHISENIIQIKPQIRFVYQNFLLGNIPLQYLVVLKMSCILSKLIKADT